MGEVGGEKQSVMGKSYRSRRFTAIIGFLLRGLESLIRKCLWSWWAGGSS